MIAEYVTAMVFFIAAILFAIAPPEVAFSGFFSTAFWLIFPGLVHRRRGQPRRPRRPAGAAAASVASQKVTGMVFGNTILGVAMAFIMPSAMGRILLLLPIFSAIAARHARSSRPYVGGVLSGILGTFFPAVTILPANVPNVVLIGGPEAMALLCPISPTTCCCTSR